MILAKKKLRVGWFSFSCCEDSTIIFTELLNKYYLQWLDKIEFCSILVLKKKSEIKDLDVAFVEGAITSEKQKQQLFKIRAESKKLVAIGSCACIGMPSAQRNYFDQNTNEAIKNMLIRFDYAKKVEKLKDLVTVDAQVPGCPMDENVFLKILNQYLLEFSIS